MADFCSENTEVITSANYTAKFAGKSCLPNNGDGWPSTNLDANGLVTPSTAVTNHVTSLLSAQKFNAAAPNTLEREITAENPASEFADAAVRLRTSINSEYCFYYKRYLFALQDILMKAATSTTVTTDPAYLAEKANAEALNSKLNQILQIMQALVNNRLASLKSYYNNRDGVNTLNTQLDKTRASLIEHANKLKNADMETNVKQSMIDYTLEKNSSSRNLLGIYGFMNIVAVGLLFYLYRNSK